jgi:serine/threonine-protein kinase
MRQPFSLLVFLVIGTVVQIVHFYPHLPDVPVSHWGPGGEPDGWLKRVELVWAIVLSELGTTGCFVAIALLFPRLPKRWINLPNKDYWFAPEQRAGSVRYVQGQMLWAAAIIQISMILLWQSTINANVSPGLRLPVDFWWTLAITTVIFIVWVIRFLRYFSSVPGDADFKYGQTGLN